MSQAGRNKPEVVQRARALRRHASPLERALWQLLRGKRLWGHRFRRQHPIGPFFADFYCASARLAVELDGESHVAQHVYDAERTAYLRGLGIDELRFTNRDVREQPDAVVEAIWQAIVAKRGARFDADNSLP